MKNIVGERIKELRKSLRLSQAELGEKIGVAQQTIFRWEHGIRTPKSSDLVKIAKALNTTVSYLVGEVDTPHPIPTTINKETKIETKESIALHDLEKILKELVKYQPDTILFLRSISKNLEKLSPEDLEMIATNLKWTLKGVIDKHSFDI